MRHDHWLHFNVCFWITSLGTIPWYLWHRQWMLWLPLSLGLVASFYKEFKDIRTTGFDWTDILADVVGIGTALLLWGVSL